jgi:hypothetical protein
MELIQKISLGQSQQQEALSATNSDEQLWQRKTRKN